jgi:muramoyltetrapeptide carboxypeptidase
MIRPPFLQTNDTVALVALASQTDFALVEPAIEILQSWGLNVLLGESVTHKFDSFALTHDTRLQDAQRYLDDSSVRAVLSVRGGFGSYHLLDELSFRQFKKNPKWVVGFSDITAFHGHLNRLGFESLHATMPKLYAQEGGQEALESLKKALFGEEIIYQLAPHQLNRQGVAQGQLIGGNLALLTHLIGSRSMPDFDGKILFIEDIDENLYRIDRMLLQLKRAKKLKNLAGLVVGHFSNAEDGATPFGLDVNQIIAQCVAEYDFPTCFGFPVGHEAQNMALPCGREAVLTVTSETTKLNCLNS